MTVHPPAHEVLEPWHEDRTEQGVPKNYFIRMKFLESGGRWIWRILAMLALMALAATLLIISYVGLGVLASLLLASGAYAHEAPKTVKQPLGWLYPYACCSTIDCRPAKEGEVRETPSGYVMSSTGETVPYTDKRVKDSPDGLFHTCQQGGNFDTGRVLCLFRPPRGF